MQSVGCALVIVERRRKGEVVFDFHAIYDPRASSAVSRAFQARSAHFTRAGNRATPDKARSEPSSLSSALAWPSMTSRKRFRIESISARLFPFTSWVIMEAEACEIEHPRP